MTKYATTAAYWDTNGNMTKLGTHIYSWDDADRMTKYDNPTGTANDATHAYLPGTNIRYKRTQDATTEYYIFDGANVIADYDGDDVLQATYATTEFGMT